MFGYLDPHANKVPLLQIYERVPPYVFVVERGSYNQFKIKLLNLGILITFRIFPMHGLCCGLRPHTWHVRFRYRFHGLRT